MNKPIHIFTIGHSTHPIDNFIAILKHYQITELVDIHTIPKSRHNPHGRPPWSPLFTTRNNLAMALLASLTMRGLSPLRKLVGLHLAAKSAKLV